MDRGERMTRQEFLRAGAAAGATAVLTAGTAAEEGTKPVRVGMVGVGSRGTHLLQILAGMPGVEVRAVCDIVQAHAARAQQFVEDASGARPDAYTQGDRDFERMCARDDLDAVVTATPWEWHTPVSVAAMRAGKYAATEVPAAITVEECWDLVRTSEQTGVPCMMLENVCYFRNVLALLRMVREGVLGEILHCQGGYQHDCRYLLFNADGTLTWRGRQAAAKNGNLYPTHPIGPIAWWMGVNRGDRFTQLVSMSTPAMGMRNYAAGLLGPDHEAAQRDYALGDVNTTFLKTAKGRTVVLYFDMCTPRPYDLIFRVQGTKGLYMGTFDQIYLEGVSPKKDQYEPFAPYLEKYAHPLWEDLQREAVAHGGHGGSDYITLHQFVQAVRNQTQTPQDAYDAATWSVIFPLSIESVAKGGATLDFPDFTNGKWKTNPPVAIHGA